MNLDLTSAYSSPGDGEDATDGVELEELEGTVIPELCWSASVRWSSMRWSSRLTLVTDLSGMPHGTITSKNRRSVATLRARPWELRAERVGSARGGSGMGR